MLHTLETIDRLRAWRAGVPAGASVALVPTMGALHAGHAALMDAARRECAVVVVSIFVNPLQFNSRDDLTRYPRTFAADLDFCRERGVDVVFAPSETQVYREPPECTVNVGRLNDHLCGPFRPGHFTGVATVVLKLFHMVEPHRAYFGEKDVQQLAIIRKLATDFDLPIDVRSVPTVREADGLALSSRNRHLNNHERGLAICLYRALDEARQRILGGERRSATIQEAARATIPQSEIVRLEYIEIVDPSNLRPVDVIDGRVLIAGAVWIGSTRLIDNITV